MFNSLSKESQKSLSSLMLIWFAMFGSIFAYLFVCYFTLIQGDYKAIYNIEVLQNNLFMNINIYTTIYILAATVFIFAYINFKKSYSKIVADTNSEKFNDLEEEFKYFKEKYLTTMFIYLAVFESIIIFGIIIFLLTLDFTTLIALAIITAFGFIIVMPSKSKFNYKRESFYFS